jgi:uncharacterized membrane protein YedE/YeeE
MKLLKFLGTGILFGIIMVKSQVISWYRIQEMFLFDSFHMYGVIGTAVTLGVIGTYLIKRRQLKTVEGDNITFTPKNKSIVRYLVGGTIFGLGWSMVGACPGPMFVLLGSGYATLLIVIFGALVGTFVYGLVRPKLPH